MPLKSLRPHGVHPLQPHSIPWFRVLGVGCILFTEVEAMKRRRFLSQAIKSASATVCSQVLPPALRASLFSQGTVPKTSANSSVRPQLALTIDDPTLTFGSILKWQEAIREPATFRLSDDAAAPSGSDPVADNALDKTVETRGSLAGLIK